MWTTEKNGKKTGSGMITLFTCGFIILPGFFVLSRPLEFDSFLHVKQKYTSEHMSLIGITHLAVGQNTKEQITGSPPLLSDLDILCEMEHEGLSPTKVY